MDNKCNGNFAHLKKKTNENNIRIKKQVNYHPKIYLEFFGSKNNSFFFGDRYRYEEDICVRTPISQIFIQKQFSLNGQLKILKKWIVNFKNIALMKKSNELISLCEHEIQKWKIDCSFNLGLDFQTIFKYPVDSINSHGDFFQDPYQIQAGIMGDWIAASKKNHIFFFKKEIDGTWNCIQKMNTPFLSFLLNDEGNILLIQQRKDNQNIALEFVILIKNSMNEWVIIKKMDANLNDKIYFLDNEQFVIVHKTSDLTTIWQVQPLKLEVMLLQKLKFGLERYELIYGMIVMKQGKLLVFQTDNTIIFVNKKNNNNQFTIKEIIKMKKDSLSRGEEEILIEIQIVSDDEQGLSYRPGKIQTLKIYEN